MRQLWHSSQNHFHYDNVSAQFPNLNAQHTNTHTHIHVCMYMHRRRRRKRKREMCAVENFHILHMHMNMKNCTNGRKCCKTTSHVQRQMCHSVCVCVQDRVGKDGKSEGDMAYPQEHIKYDNCGAKCYIWKVFLVARTWSSSLSSRSPSTLCIYICKCVVLEYKSPLPSLPLSLSRSLFHSALLLPATCLAALYVITAACTLANLHTHTRIHMKYDGILYKPKLTLSLLWLLSLSHAYIILWHLCHKIKYEIEKWLAGQKLLSPPSPLFLSFALSLLIVKLIFKYLWATVGGSQYLFVFVFVFVYW